MITPCQQGVTPPASTYAAEVNDLFGTDVVAYWKMDAASGNQPDYAANPLGDKPLAPAGGTSGGTYDISGALPAAQDDGAMHLGTSRYFTANATTDSPHPRWGFAAGTTPDEFTVSFFLRINSISGVGSRGLVGTWSLVAPSALGWKVSLFQDRRFYFYAGTSSATEDDLGPAGMPVLSVGSWHHIACTYTPAYSATHRMIAYVNGASVNSMTTVRALAEQPVIWVGGEMEPSVVTADIDMDEVLIVKREATAAEVAALYTASL